MERRYEALKRQLLHDTEIKPQVVEGLSKRLEQFTEPFAAVFIRHDSKVNARMYPGVLLSDVDCKDVESIAY